MCLLSRALISPQRLYEQVQCMLPAFYLVQYHDVTVRTWISRRPATVPCIGTTLITTVEEGCYYKVVRPTSDQGLRCTDKDRSKETEDQALISAIKHIVKFVYEDYNYSLAKPDPCFSFESRSGFARLQAQSI